MTATTVTDTRTGEPTVGDPRELARYTVPGGERVLLGQRIDGIVRFLPERRVVLVVPLDRSEDHACRPREARAEDGRPNAAQHKRPNPTGANRRPPSREASS